MGSVKQNITLAIDKSLLRKARVYAAQRGISMSAMLADVLLRIVERDTAYEHAKGRALARLRTPFNLGCEKPASRESLHDRPNQ
jgi:hypothetical protein